MKKSSKMLKKHRLFEKIGYVFKIACSIPFMLKTQKNNNIWLMGLGDDNYANNGKAFYEFLKENHPEIEVFWVCEKENKKRLSKYIEEDALLSRGTLKNYIMASKASVAIYGFSDFDIAPGYYRILKKQKTLLVNISHGFDGLKGMPEDYYKSLPVDLLCAASDYEKKAKIEKCGADESKVAVTGFARYDSWNVDSSRSGKVKNIFIMPTWRDWYETENAEWSETTLFKQYDVLFRELEKLAEKENFEVEYNFHPRMKLFFENAHWDEFNRIKQADENKSIQESLIWADLVVTDYSSIFWDALYMRKKLILFWVDEEEYRQKRGLLAEADFYPYIAKTSEQFLNAFELLNNKESEDIDIVEKYFNWQDKNNCKRIYEEIEKIMQKHQVVID